MNWNILNIFSNGIRGRGTTFLERNRISHYKLIIHMMENIEIYKYIIGNKVAETNQ